MGTIEDTAVSSFPVTRTSRSLVPPSSAATPRETLRLSVIDRVAGLRHLVRSLHVFENKKKPPASAGTTPAKALREALGKALVDYYPFAGRFVEEDGEVRVACTGEGAWFVEASAACSLEEVRHLDHPMLIPKEELLPEPKPDVNPLDMPLMMQKMKTKTNHREVDEQPITGKKTNVQSPGRR